jgi:hypothetical protein
LSEEFEKFMRPIRNASSPGTLAALCLTAFRLGTGTYPLALKFGLLLGAVMFLLSAFFIFFYSIYPTWKKLWSGTAIFFLLGLFCLILSSVALLFTL